MVVATVVQVADSFGGYPSPVSSYLQAHEGRKSFPGLPSLTEAHLFGLCILRGCSEL